MDSQQEAVTRIGDIWALLYYHLARELTGQFGVPGDGALRRAIRKFGRERGLSLRALHIYEGRPISLKSLFEHYDLPSDPRSERTTYELSEQERITKTTACPYADLWLSYPDGGRLGRIYCEEIHHAIFSGYDAAVQTNLTDTITQGHEGCRFAVYLRPSNQRAQEHVVQPHVPLPHEDDPLARTTDMWINLYYYVAREYLDTFGESGEKALRRAIRAFGEDRAHRMIRGHEAQGLPINIETLFTRRDQPSDPREESVLHRLTHQEWILDVLRCSFYDAWKVRGGLDVGLIYCQEVHHAMWETYDTRLQVNLPETLTAGDGLCEFRVYCKEAGESKGGQRPGNWSCG